MSNNTSDSGSIVISKEEFDEITLLLKNVQIKTAKIEESQSEGYKWNLQHHENLKKVIGSLNQITKLLKGNLPPSDLVIIEPEENISKNTSSDSSSQSSNNSKKTKSATKQTFHEMVLKAYNGKDYCTPETQKLFRNLNDETFSELKDSSAFILLKVAVRWLSDPTISKQQEKVNKSVAFLWGCQQDFSKILSKRESHADVKLALEGLERLDSEGKLTNWIESETFPLNEEELCELRLCLERCLVV